MRDQRRPDDLARRGRRTARRGRSSAASPTTPCAAWSRTDALIGTFASLHDPSLVQNRCFLYHLIGNGTGEWRVPVGGMGAVTDALARAAADGRRRDHHLGRRQRHPAPATTAPRSPGTTARATTPSSRAHVLANVAPWVLRILMGEGRGRRRPSRRAPSSRSTSCSTGCPRLKSGRRPARSPSPARSTSPRTTASSRRRTPTRPPAGCPTALPGEVYCHSLTDPSILGDLAPTARTR